jgi:hypothetical protein
MAYIQKILQVYLPFCLFASFFFSLFFLAFLDMSNGVLEQRFFYVHLHFTLCFVKFVCCLLVIFCVHVMIFSTLIFCEHFKFVECHVPVIACACYAFMSVHYIIICK